MISDVTPPGHGLRPKPKRIEPLERPRETPIYELAAREDPTFKTPEEVAKEDETPANKPTTSHYEAPKGAKKMLKLLGPGRKPHWPHTKKQRIIAAGLAVLVALGIGAGWTLTHHKRTVVAVGPQKHIVKKVTPPPVIYSSLSGLPISDASLNQKPVTAVMVENSLDARPQSGLSEAGVVFEAVAEGGVTRFMALYQDTAPTNVGPIRSARPYYVQWALGFDAAYAHVGGSPDALSDISAWGVKDMNQFSNGGSYHRISARAAPHNVYTGIDTLNRLESNKGYSSAFTGFARKADAAAPQPTATAISFGLSGYTYDPHYAYNATTNSYDRSEAGEVHTDANTGKQLSPKVIIAMVVPMGQGALDSSGAYYSDYNPLGSGQAYVFQDGTLTMATWSKASNNAPLKFTNANGADLPMNRGQTWISAVTAANKVSYK